MNGENTGMLLQQKEHIRCNWWRRYSVQINQVMVKCYSWKNDSKKLFYI